MAISISPQDSNFFGGSVFLVGDGVSTSVSFDLQKAPIGSLAGAHTLDFNGNLPVQVFITNVQVINATGTVDSSFTASTSINKTKVTLTFNNPLPAATFPFPSNGAGRCDVNFVFLYSGE